MNKVGFIGLGIMGRPMALNLVKGGVDLYVNDIDPAAVNVLTDAGAKAADLAAIGRECDIIITILIFFRTDSLFVSSSHPFSRIF